MGEKLPNGAEKFPIDVIDGDLEKLEGLHYANEVAR